MKIVTDAHLDGMSVVERQRLGDAAGFWLASSVRKNSRCRLAGSPSSRSTTRQPSQRGSVRGMHFQKPPHAEMKLVVFARRRLGCSGGSTRPDHRHSCAGMQNPLARQSSRTVDTRRFAHGFQTLVRWLRTTLPASAPYTQSAEGGVHDEDPTLAIAWPLPLTDFSLAIAAIPCLTPTIPRIHA